MTRLKRTFASTNAPRSAVLTPYPTPVASRSPATVLAAALVAMIAGGCVSLSPAEVESRLQRLRFYPNMYVVRAGDTLETVAFRYQLTAAELASLNPGVAADLRPGMRINVRPGTELDAEVRDAARIARRPADAGDAPVPSVAASNAVVPEPAAVRDAPQSATIIATAPPAPQAVRVEPPAARQATRIEPSSAGLLAPRPPVEDVVIEEAAFDAVTGGHPREEVIADDLDTWSIEPAAGYVPVPSVQASGSTQWVWPMAGEVARGYAPERVGGQGIDIAGRPGQDVHAAAAGTVIYSGKDPSGSGGSLVIVDHGDELMTTYSHADQVFVAEDDVVRAGDTIASLGANARAESVLSFEVRRAGSPLDPLPFLGTR